MNEVNSTPEHIEEKAYRLTLSLVNGAKAIRQVSQEDLNCSIAHYQASQWMQVEDTYFQMSKVCSVEVEGNNYHYGIQRIKLTRGD